MERQFPVFLRLANGQTYYRIESESRLVEFQRIGQKWIRHELDAKILPERHLLNDLLNNVHGNVEEIDEEEFEKEVG